MKEFCAIPGNEQYCSLIDPWKTAASSFTHEARQSFPMKKPDEIASLQRLLGSQWQAFEHDFTNWLKQNNQTESFIREKAEAIIRQSLDAEENKQRRLTQGLPMGVFTGNTIQFHPSRASTTFE